MSLMICALGLAAATSGCATDPVADDDDERVATASQGIVQCRDAACDGLLPKDTTCINDGTIVADGKVFDGSVQIGAVVLFYSPSCHAVWGATGFYQDQSHRVCSVRRAAPDNLPICKDYKESRGYDAPMRHLGIGRTGFGRTVLLTDPSITGRTGDFTRTQ
jgi:hypothetical protein